MIKLNTMPRAFGLSALLMIAGNTFAAEVKYAPAEGAVIRYPWKITMTAQDSVQLVRHVGAKSAMEPAQAEPNVGWTHTSDWIALTLKEPALLTVEIETQPGVQYSTFDSATNKVTDSVAGGVLYPASSVYEGVDFVTEVGHMYNPKGNFSANIKFLNYAEDATGSKTLSYKLLLAAGDYSMTIAGINAKYCKANDPCFGGRHGYRAKLTTEPVPQQVK